MRWPHPNEVLKAAHTPQHATNTRVQCMSAIPAHTCGARVEYPGAESGCCQVVHAARLVEPEPRRRYLRAPRPASSERQSCPPSAACKGPCRFSSVATAELHTAAPPPTLAVSPCPTSYQVPQMRFGTANSLVPLLLRSSSCKQQAKITQ